MHMSNVTVPKRNRCLYCWRDMRRLCLKPDYFQRCEAQGKYCAAAYEKYDIIETQLRKGDIRGIRL